MSRRGLEGGRKKSPLDPRRHVKCPVSECKQFPLPTSFALPAFKQMKDFLMNCDKIICHDRVDYKTMHSGHIKHGRVTFS